jgi:capsular exopolysaccharide synthesis family protein
MDLAGYLAVLRRRFPALLLCVIAGLIGGYYKGHHTAATYQATARSLVTLPSGTLGVQESLAGAQLSSSFVATYANVATSRSVAQKVVTSLQLPQGVAALQGQLHASVEPNTYIIDITASDQDPATAASLADAAAVALGERVNELESSKPARVQAQLLDHAEVPTQQTSPRPKSDLLLGFSLGLLIGIAVVALIEALDRTIKTPAQGDAAFTSPMLALIPRRRGSGGLVIDNGTNAADSEPYRALRTSVHFTDPDFSLRSILITSTSPGEGKTTTAANLALALAAAGDRVVLVDADLRRSSLGSVFGLEAAVGLSSLVLRTATLDDALQNWGRGLTILPCGRPLPPNPSEVLGSNFMSQLLEELTTRFDVVVIDTPPILPVTDAVALATQVDGVMIVARHGAAARGPAAEARRRLEAVGANVIGYELNAVPARESSGYYADYQYNVSPGGRRPGSRRGVGAHPQQ